MPGQVEGAVDGRGLFWNCLGCICLEDEDSSKIKDILLFEGACTFEYWKKKGIVFDPNCEEGRRHLKNSGLQRIARAKVIF